MIKREVFEEALKYNLRKSFLSPRLGCPRLKYQSCFSVIITSLVH